MKRTLGLFLCLATAACGAGDDQEGDRDAELGQTLFVARQGGLVSFDIATGEERPGSIQDVTTPVDIQALDNGILGVNLTTRGETLFFDGASMLEISRIHSSNINGERPVHTMISPERAGKRYWLTLNDGVEGDAATNSAAFVDLDPDSTTYLQIIGEVRLGVGHHKAAFSASQERVVISNIADCEDVMSVYDYSDVGDIQLLATFTGEDAGFTAEDPGDGNFDPLFCDPTYQRGMPPAPHGCATSAASGKAYCSVTSSGDVIVVDLDADPPTFTRLATSGLGGGYTLAHPGGRFMYTMQESPREGGDGDDCQIGQVVVTDATTDAIAAELPVRYAGPSCRDVLTGTPAETANFSHAYFHGDRLFIPTAGGFMVEDARVDQLLILDVSEPESPTQLDSIQVGVHTSHSSATHSGDGKWLFVVHSVDDTVAQIDCDKQTLVKTLTVGASPVTVATYGTVEGPSHQTGPID